MRGRREGGGRRRKEGEKREREEREGERREEGERTVATLHYDNISQLPYLGGGSSQLSKGNCSGLSKVTQLQGSCLVSYSRHGSLCSCYHLTSRLGRGAGRRESEG